MALVSLGVPYIIVEICPDIAKTHIKHQGSTHSILRIYSACMRNTWFMTYSISFSMDYKSKTIEKPWYNMVEHGIACKTCKAKEKP